MDQIVRPRLGRRVLLPRGAHHTNGAIYAKAGIAYFSDTYDGFALREAGNATLAMPVLRPVIKDQVIADQLDGLLILAPFSECAITCHCA